MSNNLEDLKKYFPIADFIAQINGPKCEAIVHDLSDLQHSIVHIVNGQLSGRVVGGSITKYALDLIMKEEDKSRDAFMNYTGTNEKTGKILRSSTLFIRNRQNETIGLLCVNIDVTEMIRLREELDGFIMVETDARTAKADEAERFDLSAEEIVDEIINGIVQDNHVGLPPQSLSDKKDLVAKMSAKGVFKFKGAVNHVAARLDISPQTLYRYLKDLEK